MTGSHGDNGDNGDPGDRRGQPSEQAGGVGEGDDLAATLAALARTLQDEDDVQKTLQSIVRTAVGTVPGAQRAALTLVERRHEVHTQAGTDEVVFAVDKVQYETGQGP